MSVYYTEIDLSDWSNMCGAVSEIDELLLKTVANVNDPAGSFDDLEAMGEWELPGMAHLMFSDHLDATRVFVNLGLDYSAIFEMEDGIAVLTRDKKLGRNILLNHLVVFADDL